ncbi:hypothetical protein [Tsuneonella mangrovi]|uniref:hypothetical protein n=1 Tax=Tsuneonella mangrovi TaxID=1982042 RepID=UPI000BA21061|nr:hypothetical protein [Tsuneonella mangrovi]
MGEDRIYLATRSLTRLAEQRGDVAGQVINRFYRDHPDARSSFEHHGLGQTRDLEGRMATESIFMLLQWVEDPAAARIDQGTTIVHHNDTLQVPPRWYLGLVDAALAVLFETFPPDASNEHAMWLEVRADYAAFVDSLRGDFLRPDDSSPLPTFFDPA